MDINEKVEFQARAEYIEVDSNVRLHITDAGEGRPIILIHGWPLSDEMYEYQYNELLAQKYRVIGITLRGFGKSDKPYGEYDYDVHAKDIHKVLMRLNIRNAVLCGFSMGGAIAVRFVTTRNAGQVTKLVLAGAALPLWTQRDDFSYNVTKKEVDGLIDLLHEDRPQLLKNFSKIFSAEENTLSVGKQDWLYAMGMSASSYATEKCLVALRDTDMRNELVKVKIPTLILHGKKDKICLYDMAEATVSGITDSQLIPFENSGHSLFLEETKKFNAAIVKFAKT